MNHRLKKIFPLILLILLTLGACSSEKEYREALKIFKSSDPDRHLNALRILKHIPNRFHLIEETDLEMDNPTRFKADELMKEIEKDYIEVTKKLLYEEYADTRIAYCDHEGINIISLDKKVHIKEIDYTSRNPKWSPSGKYLAISGKTSEDGGNSGNRILIYDRNGKEIQALTPPGKMSDVFPEWMNEDQLLFVRSGSAGSWDPHQLIEIDRHTGKEKIIFTGESASPIASPQYMKKEKKIIFVYNGKLSFMTDGMKSPEQIKAVPEERVESNIYDPISMIEFYGMDLSNDQEKIIFYLNGGKIFSMKDNTIKKVGPGMFPSFSPDDKYIIYSHVSYKSVINIQNVNDAFYLPSILITEGFEPDWSPRVAED